MIEQITIRNFKSFKDVTLKLGPMNVFIGANASGKSNFFDALRVLQGIGYGFTLAEILEGKPTSTTSEIWEGIRGGGRNASFAFEDISEPIHFRVDGTLAGDSCDPFSFDVAFSPRDGLLCTERLSLAGDIFYESLPLDTGELKPEIRVQSDWWAEPKPKIADESRLWERKTLTFDRSRPVLTQIVREAGWATTKYNLEKTARVARVLADMQRIDPSPTRLRDYSQLYEIKRMGERGENFAALIRMICNNPKTKEAYLSWLRELRPHDIDDVDTRETGFGDIGVIMKEKGREWPTRVLSDGTLRFAALAAAFFQPDMPGMIIVEEIENGIHASRLRLLVELIRSQTALGKTQVMVTTHSPVVLAWLTPEEYATTFYCRRDEETGESRIIPLSEVPRFKEIANKQSIGDLLVEDWFEGAL